MKILGNPLALCNKAVGTSQTTIGRPQQGLLIMQLVSTALTSLLL